MLRSGRQHGTAMTILQKPIVPMALIGAWHVELEADREILSYVADRKHEMIEDNVARLLRFDDSPV